jgi:site-specific DNA-methyltransferase (adenine-specific)
MKIRDRIKELRRVPACDLIPNPRNWRTHGKAQAEALQGLLAEVGFAGAVLARETPEGLMLIDGHLRSETAGAGIIPVLVLDVTESEADKILATYDPIGSMADSDAVKLDSLLRDVQTGNQALATMLAELAEAAGVIPKEENDPISEDAVPEPPVDPITKPGDLWVLGEHRVLCGDSTKAEDVARLMNKAKADLLLTDPPYGIDYARAGGRSGKHGWSKLEKTNPIYEWDKDRPSKETIQAAVSIARESIIWGGNYFADYLPPSMGWLVWDKGQRDFSLADCELAWRSEKKAARVLTLSRAKALQDGKEHPTQKPVALMAWCINQADDPKQIYDPFLGSGTTLIAAEQLGRKCYGMEISPAYCDVIIKRWETLTGKKAVLSK